AAGLAVALGVGVLAWTMAGEIAAAAGDVTVSRDIRPTLGEPFTWVDDNTHLKPTLYLAQGVLDQNPEWLLEFWNRSITAVSSIDASLKGPGPSGAPNLTAHGKLYWTHDPSNPARTFVYGVEDWPCIDLAGRDVAHHSSRGSAAPRHGHHRQVVRSAGAPPAPFRRARAGRRGHERAAREEDRRVAEGQQPRRMRPQETEHRARMPDRVARDETFVDHRCIL